MSFETLRRNIVQSSEKLGKVGWGYFCSRISILFQVKNSCTPTLTKLGFQVRFHWFWNYNFDGSILVCPSNYNFILQCVVLLEFSEASLWTSTCIKLFFQVRFHWSWIYEKLHQQLWNYIWYFCYEFSFPLQIIWIGKNFRCLTVNCWVCWICCFLRFATLKSVPLTFAIFFRSEFVSPIANVKTQKCSLSSSLSSLTFKAAQLILQRSRAF